jgi:hypothetical protein
MGAEDRVQVEDVAYANINADGTVLAAFNCSVVRVSAGRYDITHNSPGPPPRGQAIPESRLQMTITPRSNGAFFAVASAISDDVKRVELFNNGGIATDVPVRVTISQILNL